MLAALEQCFECGRALSNALDLVRKTPQDSVYPGEHVGVSSHTSPWLSLPGVMYIMTLQHHYHACQMP